MPEFFKSLEAAKAGTTQPLDDALAALQFNDAGLIPAIAQDAQSGEVLMFAWMNRAALDATLSTGRVTYFSRSRNELWRKGDTSGHIQQLKEMRIDCDGDVLLLKVEQTGAACHTHRRHCFYTEVDLTNKQVVVSNADATPNFNANNNQ